MPINPTSVPPITGVVHKRDAARRTAVCAGLLTIAMATPFASAQRVIAPEQMKHYVEKFNTMEPEKIVNLIPNAQAWEWMTEQVPFFACPDKQLEEMYYFRFWTYRKHIKQLDFIALTEFLNRKNPVSSAVGHHIREGRWLHDDKYMDQYLTYWLRGKDGQPHDKHSYSSWTVWSAYQRYLVNGDRAFVVGMLDDFVADYRKWEQEHKTADNLYWQFEARDAMEESINGARRSPNRRPSISAYMFGNAQAIAAVAELAGRAELAAEFTAKADAIKKAVQEKLWDPQAKFFKTSWPDGELSDAREAIGFIPWYFGLPDRGYEAAWKQVTDTRGFMAPVGLTTAERRHPDFRTHGSGHGCEWDGPVWPFATAQTLTAMANVLNDYPQEFITRQDYLKALTTYAKNQQMDGKPYIGEYQDEITGEWLRTDKERGRYYNHSTFCDLVISGLVGIRPQPDDTLEVSPLVPADTWDWFALDNVKYHGKNVAVVWDKTGEHFGRGAGLTVLADGKVIAHSDKLERVKGALPK